MKNCQDRVGTTHTTTQGYIVEVLEYNSYIDCLVKFNDEKQTIEKVLYSSIKSGMLRNPNHRACFGVGYMGQGEYTSKSRSYTYWYSMIRRCHSELELERNPTYKDVTIFEDWECHQNFAKWFFENYTEGFQLDKDILFKGNKIYSPETCCFIPHEINKLFTKRQNDRGELPIGVTSYKGRFCAQLSHGTQRRHLGVFDTIEEAFQAYKTAKEIHIKEVAEKYKHQITKECYQALYAYEVEITD